MLWYVLQVEIGKELTVRDSLIGAGFFSSVPREERRIHKSGGWTAKEYVLFPGYVFIQLNYTAESYYKVTEISFVQKFLGIGSSPSPLSYLETEWIKMLSCEGLALTPTKVKLSENSKLEVVSGALQSFEKRLLSVDRHKRRAKFEITICGEPKEMELSIEII